MIIATEIKEWGKGAWSGIFSIRTCKLCVNQFNKNYIGQKKHRAPMNQLCQ